MGRVTLVQNRIGILGGTFDPIHLGHLILAEEALYQLRLDVILFLITPFPPHKTEQEITHLGHRLKMLDLAIESNPYFRVSRVDIDRQPPHYAVDSLEIIRKLSPQSKIFYLMGGDSLRDLPRWHRAEQFVHVCDGIGVMRRRIEGETFTDLFQPFPELQEKVVFLTAPQFDISSREIRNRVSLGLPFRYFLPPSVYAYILSQGLYQGK
ncbi:MAG: nicotinate-nucleotide adenylyltransferase [Anaerolineales bacterium]